MRKFLTRFVWWLTGYRYFVILDATDSAVTLSEKVFRHICGNNKYGVFHVFVFHIPSTDHYGFMINPTIEEPTQMSDIQYNTKHECIGFETLCPTVARILYDYGIHKAEKCKLSVTPNWTDDGQFYYRIERPKKNAK